MKRVVSNFTKYYNLKSGDRVLDVGCAKGFLVKDFLDRIHVYGIDISNYAIDNP